MEILEITSSHGLTMSIPDRRPAGAHSYQINCRQFVSAYQSWKKHNAGRGQAFGAMTLGFERIWMTEGECAEVAAAIQASRSPIGLG